MQSELVMAITTSETDEGCSLTIPRIVVSWAPVLQQHLHTCTPAIVHFAARMHCHSPLWPDNTACQRQLQCPCRVANLPRLVHVCGRC